MILHVSDKSMFNVHKLPGKNEVRVEITEGRPDGQGRHRSVISYMTPSEAKVLAQALLEEARVK